MYQISTMEEYECMCTGRGRSALCVLYRAVVTGTPCGQRQQLLSALGDPPSLFNCTK